jgi:hypothetical protein
MRSSRFRLMRASVVAALVGVCVQLGGCSLGGIAQYVANINPCLSVLACDPVTYRFETSGYRGPGADPNIDPVCTYPPFCQGDPFVATVAP